MARIITISCQKGGVGKSTTTINLAYELVRKGKRVLVLDFDSQGDTTKYLSSRSEDESYYIGDVLLNRKFDISQAIYPAVIAGETVPDLFILKGRSGDAMTKLALDMSALPKREERLNMHLSTIKHEFDFILIDTPPNANVLLMNAVISADEFIFPSEYKEHSFDGVEGVINHICEVTFSEEEELDFMIVPTKISKSATRALGYGREYLESRFPDNTSETTIWHREVFADAERVHKPMSMFKPSSEAAMFYKNLAKEVIANEL
ncbi:ParA family protein [Vibrio mediterranei]|uniref:ParA family protein n=1 Tax=Vibrio mediterranei TaxID=689 RepID=UPI0040691878